MNHPEEGQQQQTLQSVPMSSDHLLNIAGKKKKFKYYFLHKKQTITCAWSLFWHWDCI